MPAFLLLETLCLKSYHTVIAEKQTNKKNHYSSCFRLKAQCFVKPRNLSRCQGQDGTPAEGLYQVT